MKGDLALNTIVLWIILLVTAAVIIGIILHFRGDIIRYLPGPKNECDTEKVEQASYTTFQMKTYIKGCWDKTGSSFHNDCTCYTLKGNITGVNVSQLCDSSAYPLCYVGEPYYLDVSNFDTSSIFRNITIVTFKELFNQTQGITIVIENK